MKLTIVSRGSELALWQTHWVAERLRAGAGMAEVAVQVVRTTGDRILDVPLAKIGDKGLFTKELDAALLAGEADVAVHSLKDVPTRLPEGLVLAAVSPRADARDVLLSRGGAGGASLAALPAGARVGTSSLRRRAQLRALRPDVEIVELRGNLNTRVARLEAGDYDAIILAAAGVERLGWSARVTQRLAVEAWLPAVGQGALGIVTREADAETRALLAGLHDAQSAAATTAERAFLAALEGGCQVPIAGHAVVRGGSVALAGMVSDLEGVRVLRGKVEGPVADADLIGLRLADDLRRQGAAEILQAVRAEFDGSVPSAPAP